MTMLLSFTVQSSGRLGLGKTEELTWDTLSLRYKKNNGYEEAEILDFSGGGRKAMIVSEMIHEILNN